MSQEGFQSTNMKHRFANNSIILEKEAQTYFDAKWKRQQGRKASSPLLPIKATKSSPSNFVKMKYHCCLVVLGRGLLLFKQNVYETLLICYCSLWDDCILLQICMRCPCSLRHRVHTLPCTKRPQQLPSPLSLHHRHGSNLSWGPWSLM